MWALLFAAVFCRVATAEVVSFDSKPASPGTLRAQQAFIARLSRDTGQDEEFVKRGFIATLDDPVLEDALGNMVFDASALDWVSSDAPSTVNPSLWRHMKLLRHHGLFKVTEGVWQARNLDIANMTIIQGDTGWILVDVMMNRETAAAAMDLVSEHLGKRPVSAIIYSHSHPDHFGGVRAVIDGDNIPPVYAPTGFMEEVISEFVVAGNIILRRAGFQSGKDLDTDARGFVGMGILTATPDGVVTLIPPSDSIAETGETRLIDGVEFEFQLAMESEAPLS